VDLYPVTEPLGQIAPWHPMASQYDNGKALLRRTADCPPRSPDRTFAPRQKVLDPFPLIVTQSEPSHQSAPNRLTACEPKKPPRRNRSRIIRHRLTTECGELDAPAHAVRWPHPPIETG
jgi:hypothetical protein